jgi:hypothetical protein
MKYPYQAPVSTVSYEMGIGQQNALNQANLETIQKNIETKLEDQFEDQSNKIDSELKTAVRAIKQRELKPQKEGQSDADYAKYVKTSNRNKNYYAKKVQTKSLEAVNKSSGVNNKINTKGTLKKQVYSDTDNQGEFPKTDFNISINTPDSNETFDANVEQINNEIKADMNQMDNSNFVDTTTDQSVSIEKKNSLPIIGIKTDKPLSKAQLRQLKKEENAKTVQQSKELVLPQATIDITQALDQQNQQIRQQELSILSSFSDRIKKVDHRIKKVGLIRRLYLRAKIFFCHQNSNTKTS